MSPALAIFTLVAFGNLNTAPVYRSLDSKPRIDVLLGLATEPLT